MFALDMVRSVSHGVLSSVTNVNVGSSFPIHPHPPSSSRAANDLSLSSVCVTTTWARRRRCGSGNSSGRLLEIRRVISGLRCYSLLRRCRVLQVLNVDEIDGWLDVRLPSGGIGAFGTLIIQGFGFDSVRVCPRETTLTRSTDACVW